MQIENCVIDGMYVPAKKMFHQFGIWDVFSLAEKMEN